MLTKVKIVSISVLISLIIFFLPQGFSKAQHQFQDDPLYQKIVQIAKGIDQAPIEPYIDSIWKLIPGYNGISVDIEATYKYALQNNGAIHPFMKEIPPKKSLSDFMPQPIYRGNPKKNVVALMINVAWGNEYLESILQTLAKHNIRATFFLDGTWLKKNPELARKITANHHEIGSHAYSHPMMSKLTSAQIVEELEKTNKLIEQILKRKVTLFAPPSGDFNDQVVKIAWERNMYTILWTLDTVDWRNPPVQQMVHKIITGVQPGSLILMHPTPSTAAGLEDMIIGIQNKGFYIDVVSEVISSKRAPIVELTSDF